MVTKLYYFRTKRSLLKWCKDRGYSSKACEKAWTGPGYYYARSRSHISKHTPHLDKRRKGRQGRGPWRHTHDLEKAVRRLDDGVKRASAKASIRLARKAGLPSRARPKLARTIRAKTMAKALRRARLWVRIPAVRSLAAEVWEWIPKKYRRGRFRAWTYIMALALAYNIYKRAKEKGVDPYTYDWKEFIDWSLGYRYAKEVVKEALGRTLEEIAREGMERWEALRRRYEGEDWESAIERELDEVARYELEHIDDLITL